MKPIQRKGKPEKTNIISEMKVGDVKRLHVVNQPAYTRWHVKQKANKLGWVVEFSQNGRGSNFVKRIK